MTTHIAILGAGGFLGQRLARALAHEGRLGAHPIGSLTLCDLAAPPTPTAAFTVRSVAADIADLPDHAIPDGTTHVFHLAAVVSAAAEADYALGRRVNSLGTDAVILRCAALPRPPRVVFTGSVASYSGGQAAVLDDDARALPGNSYGAQKAAAELMLTDASRRGMLDAVTVRLPTIVIRPGRPNAAASGFVSSILREPLLGLPAELPVPDEFRLWIASPRRATDWLLHAAAIDGAALGPDRGVNPPGISASVAELLAALDQVRPGASGLVRRAPDARVAGIVGQWPAAFTAARAPALGFSAHETLAELVAAFVADDLPATRLERSRPQT